MNFHDLLRVVEILLEQGEHDLATKVFAEARMAAALDPAEAPVSPGK